MSTEPLSLLFADPACLVVWKPPGVLTQAPAGIDSLEVRIRAFLESQSPGLPIYLGLPHRLDRPVSGALVMGLARRTTRKLADQFEARRVKKIYWACVHGHVQPESGTWRDWMRKIPDRPLSELLPADHADAREAILHYRVLGHCPRGTWLEIVLETGRMHQIRLQAASRGHAILGDELYASAEPFGEQFEDGRLRAIALHARELGFQHPVTREALHFTADLPAAWHELQLPLTTER